MSMLSNEPDLALPDVVGRWEEELDLVELVADDIERLTGRRDTREDLISAGREGLLQAATRYDPSRGVPFRVFARFRVRGAMLDAVRGMARLPRSVHERIAGARAAMAESEGNAEHAFAGTQSPPAEAAEAALIEHLAGMATAAAFGVLAFQAGDPPRSEQNPEEALAKAEMLTLLKSAVEGLPAEESDIVRGMYFEGQRLEDVGKTIGISKSWASRIHSRAMCRLAKRLRKVTG